MSCIKPTSVVLKVLPRISLENDLAPVYLLVESRETYTHDSQGVLKDASICVSCQQIKPLQYGKKYPKTHFHGGYSSSQQGLVSLTANTLSTGGFVVIEDNEIKGNRVGTYLMSEIVKWAKQWPNADVRSVTLGTGQAQAENLERRNKLYEKLNLKFVYDDLNHKKSGCSQKILASQLTIIDSWKNNISLISVPEYFKSLILEGQTKDDKLLELSERCSKQTEKIMTARKQPFLTAIKILFNQW